MRVCVQRPVQACTGQAVWLREPHNDVPVLLIMNACVIDRAGASAVELARVQVVSAKIAAEEAEVAVLTAELNELMAAPAWAAKQDDRRSAESKAYARLISARERTAESVSCGRGLPASGSSGLQAQAVAVKSAMAMTQTAEVAEESAPIHDRDRGLTADRGRRRARRPMGATAVMVTAAARSIKPATVAAGRPHPAASLPAGAATTTAAPQAAVEMRTAAAVAVSLASEAATVQ